MPHVFYKRYGPYTTIVICVALLTASGSIWLLKGFIKLVPSQLPEEASIRLKYRMPTLIPTAHFNCHIVLRGQQVYYTLTTWSSTERRPSAEDLITLTGEKTVKVKKSIGEFAALWHQLYRSGILSLRDALPPPEGEGIIIEGVQYEVWVSAAYPKKRYANHYRAWPCKRMLRDHRYTLVLEAITNFIGWPGWP